MRTSKLHENVCGIYCIRNMINQKVYIGKSINIRERIWNHISSLNSKNKKRENQHFINAWWKYGNENFEYFVLEIIDKNQENIENIFKDKELFWMDYYQSYNRDKGYNLRRDSSTGMITSEETKIKLSISRKKRDEKFPNLKNEVGIKTSNFWKNNPEAKKEMSKKVSDLNTIYLIEQYSKDGLTLIKTWDKVKDIIIENPTYKTHNIYSVCSGAKPTIYGYRWIKILKDDIVQPDGNILD